jgi:hypothetical protein
VDKSPDEVVRWILVNYAVRSEKSEGLGIEKKFTFRKYVREIEYYRNEL